MTKVIKLNESVLQMKLNADNRNRFVDAILSDALKARSDAIRKETDELFKKFRELTWGKTPQARAANKKKAVKLRQEAQALKDKGIEANFSFGDQDRRLNLNIGGSAVQVFFRKAPSKNHTVNFSGEFLQTSGPREYDYFHMGSDKLTLQSDDPLAIKFWKLRDEARDIKDASEELRTMLLTMMGRSKTLGAAVEKWPELANYAPAIMSACRELVVKPEDLNAKLMALKANNKSVSDALKVTADK